jgi:hypothetical protein
VHAGWDGVCGAAEQEMLVVSYFWNVRCWSSEL